MINAHRDAPVDAWQKYRLWRESCGIKFSLDTVEVWYGDAPYYVRIVD